MDPLSIFIIIIVLIPQLVLSYLLYKLYVIGKKIHKGIKPHLGGLNGQSMSFLQGITSDDVRDMMQLVKKFI